MYPGTTFCAIITGYCFINTLVVQTDACWIELVLVRVWATLVFVCALWFGVVAVESQSQTKRVQTARALTTTARPLCSFIPTVHCLPPNGAFCFLDAAAEIQRQVMEQPSQPTRIINNSSRNTSNSDSERKYNGSLVAGPPFL